MPSTTRQFTTGACGSRRCCLNGSISGSARSAAMGRSTTHTSRSAASGCTFTAPSTVSATRSNSGSASRVTQADPDPLESIFELSDRAGPSAHQAPRLTNACFKFQASAMIILSGIELVHMIRKRRTDTPSIRIRLRTVRNPCRIIVFRNASLRGQSAVATNPLLNSGLGVLPDLGCLVFIGWTKRPVELELWWPNDTMYWSKGRQLLILWIPDWIFQVPTSAFPDA